MPPPKLNAEDAGVSLTGVGLNDTGAGTASRSAAATGQQVGVGGINGGSVDVGRTLPPDAVNVWCVVREGCGEVGVGSG